MKIRRRQGSIGKSVKPYYIGGHPLRDLRFMGGVCQQHDIRMGMHVYKSGANRTIFGIDHDPCV